MITTRSLSIAAEIVNAWQHAGSAVGASDLYARHYRLFNFCDPRKKDPKSIACNKEVRLVSGCLGTSLVVTQGILHTLADLPIRHRHPDIAAKFDRVFNAWNFLTELSGKQALISQVSYFLYSQIKLGKIDPTDPQEVTISNGEIIAVSCISLILAAACNTKLRKRLTQSLPLRTQHILHGIFEGLNGYFISRGFFSSVQQLHDIDHPDTPWSNSMGGFVTRNIFGLLWGSVTGYINGKYMPAITVADMFGQKAVRAGFPLNTAQKISSIVSSLCSSFVFSVLLSLTVKENDSPHKIAQATLLAAMAAYLPLFYILIRCCTRERHALLQEQDVDDFDDDERIENENSQERQSQSEPKDQQKPSSHKTDPKEPAKITIDLPTHILKHTLLFTSQPKIKSQDRKARAIRMTRRKNKF